MDCSTVRIALSAGLDGEAIEVDPAIVASHVGDCASCRAWLQAIGALQERVVATASAQPSGGEAPDLVPAVMAAAASLRAEPLERRLVWRRWALAAIAVVQLVLALAAISAADQDHAHQFHELGAWEAALAVGFLSTAWRPARAWGMLPLVVAAVAALALAAAADVAAGHATLLRELPHALALLGLVLMRPLAIGARPALRLIRIA